MSDQAEISVLTSRIAKLEKGKDELSAFIETQVADLKDLELRRIDLALYIQTIQSHSGNWYKMTGKGI